jgi:hypothetical protein
MRQNCRAAVDWEFTQLLDNCGVDPEAVDETLGLGVNEALFDLEYESVEGFQRATSEKRVQEGGDSHDERDGDGIPIEETPRGPKLARSEWAKDPGYALQLAHASRTYAPILSTVYRTQLAAENYAEALFERPIAYHDDAWRDRNAGVAVHRALDDPAGEWERLAEEGRK